MSLLFGWGDAGTCLTVVAGLYLVYHLFSGVIDELVKIKKGDKK